MSDFFVETFSRTGTLIFIMMAVSAGMWLLLHFSGLIALAHPRLAKGDWKAGTIMAAGAGVIFAMLYASVTAAVGVAVNAGAASAILTLLVLGCVAFARGQANGAPND